MWPSALFLVWFWPDYMGFYWISYTLLLKSLILMCCCFSPSTFWSLKLIKTRWWKSLGMRLEVYHHRHWTVNIHVWTTPAFCRTLAAVASPYSPVQVTASASFSQDGSESLFSHWDIVSLMQRLQSPGRLALIVIKEEWSINCWPSCSQWPAANLASRRTFRTFLLSSCITVWKQRNVAHNYIGYFKQQRQVCNKSW